MAKMGGFSKGAIAAVIAASFMACMDHALDTEQAPIGAQRQAAAVPIDAGVLLDAGSEDAGDAGDAGDADVDSGTSADADADADADAGTSSADAGNDGGTSSSSGSSGPGTTSSSTSGGPPPGGSSSGDIGQPVSSPNSNSNLNPNLSITPGVGSSDDGCSAVPGSLHASTGGALGLLIAVAAFVRKRRIRSGS